MITAFKFPLPGLLAIGLMLFSPTCSSAQIVLSDDTLYPSDWKGYLSPLVTNVPTNFNVTQVDVGDNHGVYQEASYTVAGNGKAVTTLGAIVDTALTYDPKTQGAITKLTLQGDLKAGAATGNPSGVSFAAVQDGIVYLNNSFGPLTTNWTTYSVTPSVAFHQSFPIPQGGLNFSATGDPISFGFGLVQSGPSSIDVGYDLDNFSISITRAARPALVASNVLTTITAGSAYTIATIAPLTANGGHESTVSLAAGTASSNKSVTLSSTTLGSNYPKLASDVMGVSGNAGDAFTVQLTFDIQAAIALTGGSQSMTLMWFNTTTNNWVNAVDGNSGTNTTNPAYLDYKGSFASFEAAYGVTNVNLSLFLGAYGVDTSTDTAWAIINHNSDFGVGNPSDFEVVPEPSTWAMCVAGGLFLIVVRKKRAGLR